LIPFRFNTSKIGGANLELIDKRDKDRKILMRTPKKNLKEKMT
jgi:hypothetical protein